MTAARSVYCARSSACAPEPVRVRHTVEPGDALAIADLFRRRLDSTGRAILAAAILDGRHDEAERIARAA